MATRGPSRPAPKPLDGKAAVRALHSMLYGAVHTNPAKCNQHTPCAKCQRRHPCPATD